MILKQFDDLLVKILIVAAIVSFILAAVDGDGELAFVEPTVIVLILIANATVGVVTETNAEKAIEELKAYQADLATVLRDGRLRVVKASALVPGDIIELAVGTKVPADCRIIGILSSTLRVDQAILTGESGSVEKEAGHIEDSERARRAVVQDKTCLLFSGTVVSVGRARAVVVGTGLNTAIGKIRDAMKNHGGGDDEEELTPLKKKLDESEVENQKLQDKLSGLDPEHLDELEELSFKHQQTLSQVSDLEDKHQTEMHSLKEKLQN